MKDKLPNFLIVGAAKSGTSSLHNYLNQHPEVFMPSYDKKGMKVKEPRFLIKDLVKHRLHNGVWDWEEYKSLFNNVKDEVFIGESTVLYLYFYKHAIGNIKKYLGENVKIIIMLRNPTDRAYSAFQHVSRGFKEQNSFEEALEIEEGRLDEEFSLTPMVMYREMGLYYDMVREYKVNFKDVHIVFYEDFRDDTHGEIKKVFDFLGTTIDTNIDFLSHHNVGGTRWKNEKMKHFIMKNSSLKSVLKKVSPNFFKKFVRETLISISTDKVLPMKENTRIKLNKFFEDDVKKLSDLLNVDLTHWTK
tara:strand:- start:7768 stop:8676 length:909 start_codon:yes stop_codon:yes gene_type:complete